MNDEIKIANGRDACGTSLQGEFCASFADLRRAFGEPKDSDGYKVSTEWVLEHRGRVFTLYDYKETSLYDDGLPSVEAFRARSSYAWHVGAAGRSGVEEFKAALAARLSELPKEETESAAATQPKRDWDAVTDSWFNFIDVGTRKILACAARTSFGWMIAWRGGVSGNYKTLEAAQRETERQVEKGDIT